MGNWFSALHCSHWKGNTDASSIGKEEEEKEKEIAIYLKPFLFLEMCVDSGYEQCLSSHSKPRTNHRRTHPGFRHFKMVRTI